MKRKAIDRERETELIETAEQRRRDALRTWMKNPDVGAALKAHHAEARRLRDEASK